MIDALMENVFVQLGLIALAVAVMVWVTWHKDARKRRAQAGKTVRARAISWGAPLLPLHRAIGHTSAPSQPQSLAVGAAPRSIAMPLNQWVAALNEAPHLLIYGPSKAGKSTLAQAYTGALGVCEVCIIDPLPNKPSERKWGGIDFVTLDTTGADEYASIKAALDAIVAEDDRRRGLMDVQEFPQLVVIIDEVLALVDALGSVKEGERAREPRIANFIRRMGVSARHRNIKIILIGQGKNLTDLGLTSGTSRNNYGLIRVARNAATNERSAFIETGGIEQEIDTSLVQRAAQQAARSARVWLTHGDVRTQAPSAKPLTLESLFEAPGCNEPRNNVTPVQNHVTNVVQASGREVTAKVTVTVTPQEAAKIGLLLAELSPSNAAKKLNGYHPTKYAEYKAKVDAVKAMLDLQEEEE